MTKVGFIGIGLMGLPMCRRLLNESIDLTVFNRNSKKCDPLVAEGAKQAQTMERLAQDVDVIMLCVSNTEAVESVAEQLLPILKPGQVIVDFSSISPDSTERLAQKVSEKGASWVDCPVSGGVAGAEAGSLAMMAGGDEAVVTRLTELLAPLSQRVTYMGPSGSGQTTKNLQSNDCEL